MPRSRCATQRWIEPKCGELKRGDRFKSIAQTIPTVTLWEHHQGKG